MKKSIIRSVLATLVLTSPVRAQAGEQIAMKPEAAVEKAPEATPEKVDAPESPERLQKPRIDVVFALDTTGSMSGLIEGAKQKIWSIANTMISGKPTPEIRIGLVAYRDIGDAYVTQVHDLSEDIDDVYAKLKTFQVDGGGDFAEHVVQALDDSIHKMSWAQGKDVLKVVFLVGDAPPHTDYSDTPSCESLLKEARQLRIRVNAVRCGGNEETAKTFAEIAKLGAGDFLSIAQDGGMAVVATPHDGELAKLNAELAGTSLTYGDRDDREAASRKKDVAQALAAPAAAERASWAVKAGSKAAYGESDLLGQLSEGSSLETMSDEAMPDSLRGLSLEQKKEKVQEVQKKRAELEDKIRVEAAKRQEWIDKNQASQPADSFDKNVMEVIRRQAGDAQVTFE